MANGIIDIFPRKPCNVLLSNISPCPVHLSKNKVTRNVLKAPERILIIDVFEPYPLQCKKGEGTAEIFYSSDKDSSQQHVADPEQ